MLPHLVFKRYPKPYWSYFKRVPKHLEEVTLLCGPYLLKSRQIDQTQYRQFVNERNGRELFIPVIKKFKKMLQNGVYKKAVTIGPEAKN